MDHHTFSVEQVDDAITFVIENGAMDRAQTISYSRVFEAAGLIPPQDLHFSGEGEMVTQFMAALHHRCLELKYPPLDALVVHVAGPRQGWPGAGYFKVNKQPDPGSPRESAARLVQGEAFWSQQKAQCKAWGDERRRAR